MSTGSESQDSATTTTNSSSGRESNGRGESSSSSSKKLVSAMSAFQRRRNVRELFIQLADPHRRYGPGDTVTGRVMLRLRKKAKGTLLHVSLQGHVVLKSLSTGTNKTIPIFTPQAVQLVDAGMILEQGVHELPFEMEFPYKRIPSSLDLEADCTRSSMLHAKLSARANLTLVESIDVGGLPLPKPMLRYMETKKDKEMRGTEAKVFLGQAGALAGDSISVKAILCHTKPVKSLRGCIVTLYRLSRFDNESSEAKSFRKDLAQTVSPLFVDPKSLSGAVSTSLRIPPDTFPTIATAPLISFRYFVEVVLDLRGKLTGNDLSGKKLVTNTLGFAETDALKRENGILNMQQEITIGTMCHTSPTFPPPPKQPRRPTSQPEAAQVAVVGQRSTTRTDASSHDEKAAIRRAEEQLLPSAPEVVPVATASAPSAPADDEREEAPEALDGTEAGGPPPTKHEEARQDALRALESAPGPVSAAQPSAPSEAYLDVEHELPIYQRHHDM